MADRCFERVDPLNVERERRQAAESMLEYCRRDLNLPEVVLEYFLPEDPARGLKRNLRVWGTGLTLPTWVHDVHQRDELAGLCNVNPTVPNIRVLASLEPDAIAATVAHECYHVLQGQRGELYGLTIAGEAKVEQAATAYARRTLAKVREDRTRAEQESKRANYVTAYAMRGGNPYRSGW